MIQRFSILCMYLSIFSIGVFAQTYEEFAEKVESWTEERVENAKKGIKEKVKMPMVVRSTGWGCQCPEYYIGVSTTTHDGPWIHPIPPNKFPESDESGHSLIVTGYFTGKWTEEDLRNEDGEPEEWLYRMPEFKIISWKINTQEYDVPAPKVIK